MAWPTAGPSPLTRLNTPFGTPAACMTSQDDSGDRGDFARLQHHGAARGDGRRHLAGDLVQRPVPGRDQSNHADAFAHDARGAAVLLELEALQRLQGRVQTCARPAAAWLSRAMPMGAPISAETACAMSSMRAR